MPSSTDDDYADFRRKRENVWWKRLLDVQRPYRRHLQRLALGKTLDIGCGVGRNLGHLAGQAIGIDPNVRAVAICREAGHLAFTPEQFAASEHAVPGGYDSLLISHVVEHMEDGAALALIAQYLPYLRSGGRVVLLTPQEAGYKSDPTHVVFLDLARLESLAHRAGLEPVTSYSFPLPRAFGPLFKYNEFVAVARKP